MMAAVHALLGGAVGRYTCRPTQALLGGALSHLLADLAPHKDYPLPIELPAMLSALGFLALWHGARSPAFLGALGGVLPDMENGLWLLGVVPEEAKLFPTHSGLLPHGRPIRSIGNQVLLAAIALWLLGRPHRPGKGDRET
jgi:hypothetical protein